MTNPTTKLQIDRAALVQLIADHLSCTYHCNRAWSAWSIGTMSEWDFSDVGESDTPEELADEIIASLAAVPTTVPDITDAMVEAAEEAYMPFGDMALALQVAFSFALTPAQVHAQPTIRHLPTDDTEGGEA